MRSGEPWKYGKLTNRYFVAVQDHAGKTISACEVSSPANAGLCDGTQWFRGRKTYRVALLVQQGARATVATQAFDADGSELGIEVDVAFMSDKVGEPLKPAELHVIRLLPSIPGVSLEQTWTPSGSSSPSYRLVNKSASTLYGAGWYGNYFGYVEQRAGVTWTRLRRGGFCGTVGVGKPLAAGQTTGSIEGFFIGEPQAFTRGNYRYVLRYGTVSARTGGIPLDIYRAGRTYTHLSDEHVIAMPFDVPSS